MAEPIEQWLKQLDAILEQHQFETAEEAEAWLLEQSQNRSIDEFFEQCGPPLLRLRWLWQRAEQAQDPQMALSIYEEAIAHAETALAAEIQDARSNPSAWPESPLHPYLCCLFGIAGCREMLGQLDEAETMYRKVWDADCTKPGAGSTVSTMTTAPSSVITGLYCVFSKRRISPSKPIRKPETRKLREPGKMPKPSVC